MKRRATRASKPGPKGRGVFRIVEFLNPSGNVAFRATGWTLDGQRVRENFKTHAEATARMQELEIQAANLHGAARPVLTRLTPNRAAEAEAAFARLDKLGRGSLVDAVEFYAANYREPITQATIANAFAKFIAEREAANLRPDSLRSLRDMNRELLTRHGQRMVADITADTLRPLIFKPSRKPVSADGYRRATNAFFAWAEEQGFCAENPAAKIKPVKSERLDPQILTPAQTRRLLAAAADYKGGVLIPYVALGVFAGLRPTELARLDWSRIDLQERTITLGADIAKMRAKRIVSLTDNLVTWLLPHAVAQRSIVGPNWRRDFRAVKAAAGFGNPNAEPKGKEASVKKQARQALLPWTQDIMRHSAISYHLARCQHEGQTATWAGNSPTIIQKHYKGLVKQTAADEFWSITPETVTREIVEFPSQAAA